jgi:ankyrin repeat protein
LSTLDNLRRHAKRWLKTLRSHDAAARERLERVWPDAPRHPVLRDVQYALARAHGFENWQALRAALPERPATAIATYEQLARDVLLAHTQGDESALHRLNAHFHTAIDLEELRDGVAQRLSTLSSERVPSGDFSLAHAQLLVALRLGLESWPQLEELFSDRGTSQQGGDIPPPYVAHIAPGMIMPIEVAAHLPVKMRDGSRCTTMDVWEMLTACRAGDLRRVEELAASSPALLLCDYNYMTPLHLAVREGHLATVKYLAEHGAANPNYVTYPYRESLLSVARDRGYEEIAQVLEAWYAREDKTRREEEGGEIEDLRDEERIRFQRLVNLDARSEVEALLGRRPELAVDPYAFWFEGILSMPANRGNRPMLELLMAFGARVPDITKWGAWYYFKRDDIAEFLIARGMNPNHMNVHHTTVLHDMAYTGDVKKATLLIEAGADIDAVDEEFRSTPLGVAARFGKREVFDLLLARGADPNKAGAAWATPLAWARSKGHRELEERLRHTSAHVQSSTPAPATSQPDEQEVTERVNAALNDGDADAFAALVRAHRGVFEARWPYWLELDPRTVVARARPPKWLPVRPDIHALEREVAAQGGGEAARLAVARSYGADSWPRIEQACRLIDAIWRDRADTVRELITRHPHLLHEDAGVRHGNWGPPMAYAANLGRDRIIRMLHDMGAKDIQWALDRAVLQGQLDTARMLYEMGARPQGPAALDGPAETLNAEGMALLLDLGVTLTPSNAPVAMVLETYSRNPAGKHQILEFFASHGTFLPDTPPMAVHRGRIDLLDAHLRRDPALFSRTFSHQEIFPPELGCHADPSLALHGTPLGGAGLLHMCVEYDEMKIARWMIDRGADVNLRASVDPEGFGGHTALFNTVVSLGGGQRRRADFARLIVERGAETEVRASLRKGMPFSDDPSVHEYRDVTAVEWGERFHDRGFVNEAALQWLIERTRART